MKKKLKRIFDMKRMPKRFPKISRTFLILGSIVVLHYVYVSLSGV